MAARRADRAGRYRPMMPARSPGRDVTATVPSSFLFAAAAPLSYAFRIERFGGLAAIHQCAWTRRRDACCGRPAEGAFRPVSCRCGGQGVNARIVIIGGGAVGCGVAFQLAEAGITDVLLLEREPQLCAVTSAQAAGLVGQVRSTVERTRLAMWSVATFSRLEQEAAVKPGWRQTGSLRLAQLPERVARVPAPARRGARGGARGGTGRRPRQHAACGRAWISAPPRRSCGARATATSSRPIWSRAIRIRRGSAASASRPTRQSPTSGSSRVASWAWRPRADRSPARWSSTRPAPMAIMSAAWSASSCPVFPVRHHYVITTATDWIRPEMPVLRVPDATLYARPDVERPPARRLGAGGPVARSAQLSAIRPAAADRAGLAGAGRVHGAVPAVRRPARGPARPPCLHRLADLHARRPLHHRREPPGARLRLRRRAAMRTASRARPASAGIWSRR